MQLFNRDSAIRKVISLRRQQMKAEEGHGTRVVIWFLGNEMANLSLPPP
jgi:hypothetical protein